ncbi:hypothetical protein QVD17_05714 [Tagetes erecta]|uniref:Uncharacterized protein n=1 Tax=Tagetes erecta TaxID=13708 RepID=A0AAD8P5S2_TARER|nr:hypothetical protein QVD17_05714 [Tagetes erecta]
MLDCLAGLRATLGAARGLEDGSVTISTLWWIHEGMVVAMMLMWQATREWRRCEKRSRGRAHELYSGNKKLSSSWPPRGCSRGVKCGLKSILGSILENRHSTSESSSKFQSLCRTRPPLSSTSKLLQLARFKNGE